MACRIKPDIPSPCVNICRMDQDNRYCIGCWRTLDEIKRWAGISNAEREKVIEQLESRTGV